MPAIVTKVQHGMTAIYDRLMTLARPRKPFTPAASLTSLPPELVEIIADHLESSELCALRLVCRDLAVKTTDTFTRFHFSTRGIFIYSFSSLDTALKIAQHAVFGPAVKELRFYADMVWWPTTERETPGGFGPYVDWLAGEQHQSLDEDQQKSDAQIATLTRLFQQLSARSKPCKVVLTSIATDFDYCTRQKKFPHHRSCYDTETTEAMHRLEFTIGLLPESTLRKLWALAMETSPTEVAVLTGKLHRQRTGALSHTMLRSNIFEHLSSVSLVLQAGHLDGDQSMYHLLETLSRNTALMHLEVLFKPVITGPFFGAPRALDFSSGYKLLQQRFWRLKTLKVGCLQAGLATIGDFIDGHPTLRRLTLIQCAAIGIPEQEIVTWQNAITGGGHAFTMMKDKIGFDGLERENLGDVVLYPGLR